MQQKGLLVLIILSCATGTKRLARWLTGDEVCNRLRISQRTLQKLRDKGFIGYSQIGHKFFYKPEEVKRLIPLVGIIHPGGK